MQNLLELLKKSEEFLRKKGISNARFEAENLFAKALNCRRLDLYLQFEKPLNAAETNELRELVVRRGKREPLQHILGNADFREISLKCDARALIPRPETEEFLDHFFARFDELFAKKNAAGTQNLRVLDLGTGTGAIALSIAKERAGTNVVAVDFSAPALDLAKENAKICGLGNVEFLRSNWFENVSGTFDAIIANPPYLTEKELETAEPEVREHEPISALVAENFGISELEKILHGSFPRLSPGGFVALETGISHHEKLEKIAAELGFSESEKILDLSERPRFFFAKKAP